MSGFSGRPFVAGSIVGVRAFEVDALGRLTGPMYGHPFTPGENEAQCRAGEMRSSVTFRPMSYEPEVVPEPHRCGGATCVCGFYAYFDGSDTYENDHRVTAIIEGYGLCSVGSKGFRAEKARLLALVLPGTKFEWFHRYSRWLQKFDALSVMVPLVVGILSLSGGLTGASDSAWWLLLLALIPPNMLTLWASFHGIGCEHDARTEKVRRLYEGVPVYSTRRAALAAFDLSPLAPSPTDEDFWTRSAQ